MTEKPAAPSDEPATGSRLRRLLGTWSGRVWVLLVALGIVGSAGTAIWKKTSEVTGLAGAPVGVAVVRDPDRITTLDSIENYTFVVPGPIVSVGRPPNGESEHGRYDWAKSMGGIDAGSTVVRLIIRGRSESPVILNNLRVEVVKKAAPVAGTLVSYFGQGAGQPVRFFEIDLDRSDPTVDYLKQGNKNVVFPYRVSNSDVEVFDVYAYTLFHDVHWRLHLDYTTSSKEETMTFDDRGEPFETTAQADPSTWHAVGGKGRPRQEGYGWLHGKWVNLGST